MEVRNGEQSYYLKTAVLRGTDTQECHAEISEALDNRAQPYRTVTRWVQAFKSGIISTADIYRSGRSLSVHTDVFVAINELCRDEDRRCEGISRAVLLCSEFYDRTHKCA